MSSLIALAFVASLPAAGFAQGSDKRVTDNREKKERPAWSNAQSLHETSDILGAKVVSPDGQELGELHALLIDPKDGKVSHAVVNFGGRLGIGAEKVVVPYSALKMTGHEGGKKARITADRTALDNAPRYVKTTERQPSASPATSPAAPKTDKKY
jgi:sporulation protein YlmC with PRC-barrel domain